METQDEEEITIEHLQIELMLEANGRALRDFALPEIDGLQTSIVRPTIITNNFEIKLSLI